MSALAGVSPDTLRYYEREGLLPTPPRTSGGFRLYTSQEVDRLAFIRRAQAIGLSLDEIRDLVSAAASGARCRQMRGLIHGRIEQVDKLLADLRGLRRTLVAAERACDRALEADPSSECPVVTNGTPVPSQVPRRPLQRKRR